MLYRQVDSVTFCDLVRNPDKYDGQEVSVRATYRYGFEWQELYCLDCKDKGKAWLEVPFDLDDAAIWPLRRCLLLIPRTTCEVEYSRVLKGEFQRANLDTPGEK